MLAAHPEPYEKHDTRSPIRSLPTVRSREIKQAYNGQVYVVAFCLEISVPGRTRCSKSLSALALSSVPNIWEHIWRNALFA